MSEQIIKDAKSRMSKSEEALKTQLGKIRAGNANPSLLNHITANYYGVPTPINQIASVTVPEARILMVKPYDKSALADIERALNESDLGLPPQNDGEVIRLTIPALSEERRKEIAKNVGTEAENGKVSVRNIRRDAMDDLKKAEKAGDISEDELRQYEKRIQDITDESIKNIDEIAAEKEAEIMNI